jgi:hypothetical protein
MKKSAISIGLQILFSPLAGLRICIPFFLFCISARMWHFGEVHLEDTSMRQLKDICRLEALPKRIYRGSGWTMSAHSL